VFLLAHCSAVLPFTRPMDRWYASLMAYSNSRFRVDQNNQNNFKQLHFPFLISSLHPLPISTSNINCRAIYRVHQGFLSQCILAFRLPIPPSPITSHALSFLQCNTTLRLRRCGRPRWMILKFYSARLFSVCVISISFRFYLFA
jgi:hypothetical protein